MSNVKELVAQDKEYLVETRRHIHQNPELSFEEYNTTAFLAAELQKAGLEVHTTEGKTGLIAILKGNNPGKTLALRADIDALPLVEKSGLPFASQNTGVAHCCGHDIHTTVLLGTARCLSKCKEDLNGTVKFIFQCAEEKLAGSKSMIERGALESPRPDAIMALHCWPDIPAGTIGTKAGAFMASSDSVDVIIKGKAGHAAHPHRSIDPIVAAASVVSNLQTIVSRETAPVDSTVLTFGSIHGGTARNIIADEVKMEGTIRTVSADIRNNMQSMIERIATCTAEAFRCQAEINYTKGIPPVINNDNLTAMVHEVGQEVLGNDKVITLKAVSMGSEDFSLYMEEIPGCVFRLGTGNDQAQSHLALHNPEIIFDELALPTGVEVMSTLALKFLQ